jgi:dihydroxyacetone kinase
VILLTSHQGFLKVSPQPTPDELVKTLVQYLTDEADPERGYVKFAKDDEVALLINNFGGMSVLEMGALTDEFITKLPSQLNAIRVYTGIFESSLNAPAFALTICNLTSASKVSGVPVSEIVSFLDVKTESAWEAVAGGNQSQRLRPRASQIVEAPRLEQVIYSSDKDVFVDPKILESALRKACNRIVEVEPDLTRWDTIMGDGDCGETFKTGCEALLKELDNGLAKTGSMLELLKAVAEITETKMGGTLGAILSIFFNAYTSELARTQSMTGAPGAACRNLQHHTAARVGHRTIMDVLIPATEILEKTESLKEAMEAAVDGAEITKSLNAKLGRATYVGGMEGKELPPDPGAWGAMEIIRSIYEELA